MSQKQKSTRPKRKIEAHLHSAIIVNQPMVRDFSTGGGHLPGDDESEKAMLPDVIGVSALFGVLMLVPFNTNAKSL